MNEEMDQSPQDRIRALLDDSLQDFDGHTLSRLNQARQRALAHSCRPRWSSWRRPALGLALASALLLLAVPGWQPWSPVLPEETADAAPEQISLSPLEMALLDEPEDLELVEQLEFYAWLEQEEDWDGSS